MAPSTPSADRIQKAVVDAHEKHKKRRAGKNASYIPVLAKVDPGLFGVCVATVDGQLFAAGDAGLHSRWNRFRRFSRSRS